MVDAARQIENLLYRYAECIDQGDLDALADLFTHGRICGVENGPPETVFEGREQVRSLYDATVRMYAGTPKTKHVTTNAHIEVDGAVATARSYYSVTQATDALPLQIIITGRYHDTLQVIDGAWWFHTRVMFVDQVGDLSHHLKYALRS
jgi:ketosteroid isomerase-like protein